MKPLHVKCFAYHDITFECHEIGNILHAIVLCLLSPIGAPRFMILVASRCRGCVFGKYISIVDIGALRTRVDPKP